MTATTPRAARRTHWPDPIQWIWRRLTSVKWAIGLILAAALFSAVGVVIPQVPPQLADIPEQVQEHIEAQRPTWGPVTDILAEFPWFYETNGGVFNLYKQPYWYAVVALVALAISVCTVSRAPPIWRTVRRPPKRVNAAYFERARHRFAVDAPDGIDATAALTARLRAARYRVEPIASSDGASLLFADRFGWAQLATFITHLALLILLGATLVTKFGGEEYQFWVAEGESHPLFAPGAERPQVQIIVDDAVARFADDGQALDFRSLVRVAEGGAEVAAGDVTVNGPLHAAGYRVHQAAYWEHGAELQVFDHSSGQLIYSETHFLDQQIVGPRVRIERGGALVSEEVIGLEHAIALPDDASEQTVARFESAGYTLIPLDAERSLAIVLVPAVESAGGFEFWYRVLPLPPNASGLTPTELGIDAAPPDEQSFVPRARIIIDDEIAFDGTLTLEQEEGPARFTAVPLPEGGQLVVGFADAAAGEQFFYYSLVSAEDRGGLAPGERVTIGGLTLIYEGAQAESPAQGSLEVGETRTVGAVEITWLGAESVFYSVLPDIPGADGDALVALERFGQARTAAVFDAQGGEDVQLAVGATNQSSAGGQVGRPSRMVLGLGGDTGRIELDEGQEIVQSGYRYRYAGPREFTGLNVRRDPGGIAFWVGIGLGLLGMSLTFFMPRRRLWARIADGRVQLAGQAGHGVDYTRELERIAHSLDVSSPPRPARRRRFGGRFSSDYAQQTGEEEPRG